MKMIGSPEVNKEIRRVLSPALKEVGFSKTNTRHNWGWRDSSIWVLDITSVGSYFSDVTGWPPMSVHVELGIYYDFIPMDWEVNRGTKDELLPRAHQCHLRKSLLCTLDQTPRTESLDNPAEWQRKDLWWIEPDGSNVEEVVRDIKRAFLKDGFMWLLKNLDLAAALEEVESDYDSYYKFYSAKHLAERLNDGLKYEKYDRLLQE